jgi:hypothetical protein
MRSKYNLLKDPEFLLRRFLFIICPLILCNVSEGPQVQSLLVLQTAHIIFIGQMSPFSRRQMNLLDKSNEALFMVLSYFMVVFTDFVADK